MDSVRIVEEFWSAVWKARNPEAAANFIVDDFVITTGGVEIRGKENFIAWVRGFLQKINDFQFEVMETFQNESGSRVASLWRVTGKKQWHIWTRTRSEAAQLYRHSSLERS